MKFLCDSCKAKYQIPDEKIAGRTLRMKCRKCTKEIIIRGPKGEEKRRRPSTAGRRRPSSAAASRPSQRPRTSALGADFRRSGGTAPEPAAKPATEWYVAINDVPVGPVKREEVARKIGMGAVTAESLCWREGLDDWRPVKEVPELFALVKQRRVPAPPPVATRSSGAARPAPPPPEKRSNVIPIGGRLGGAAAAPLFDEDDEDEKTVMAPMPVDMPAAASAAPAAVAAPAAAPIATAAAVDPFAAPTAAAPTAAAPIAPTLPPDPYSTPPKRLNAGLLIALVGSAAFGIALAVVFAKKMLAEPTEIAAVDPDSEVYIPEDPVEAPVDVEMPIDDPEATADPEGAATDDFESPTNPTAENPRTTTMRTNTPAATAMTPTTTSTMRSAEEQALLDRFGGGDNDPDLGMLRVAANTMTTSTRMEMDQAALSRVVRAPANQQSVQRCYNTAIRGANNPPDARVDVTVNIGASGTVTSVSTSGTRLGSLTSCIERAVRRWRFPPSSGGARTRFPLVFSAG